MAFDLGAVPVLAVLCGRDRAAVEQKGARFGFAETATDWRTVVDRNDIDIVDVCTPGDTHMPITVAALQSGKHVLVEKPLANSVAEAETMAEAAEVARSSGQRSMVGFNYRRVPALRLARDRWSRTGVSASCATSAEPTYRTGWSTRRCRSLGG